MPRSDLRRSAGVIGAGCARVLAEESSRELPYGVPDRFVAAETASALVSLPIGNNIGTPLPQDVGYWPGGLVVLARQIIDQRLAC